MFVCAIVVEILSYRYILGISVVMIMECFRIENDEGVGGFSDPSKRDPRTVGKSLDMTHTDSTTLRAIVIRQSQASKPKDSATMAQQSQHFDENRKSSV